MSKAIQLQLEKDYSRTYSSNYLKAIFMEEGMWDHIVNISESIQDHCDNTVVPDNRPDMLEVHEFFTKLDEEKLDNMVWKMVSAILIKQSMTVAALAGIVYYDIKLENKHRVFMAIEYLLLLIDASPLAYSEITKGEECVFKAYAPLPDEMQNVLKNQGYPLPLVTRPRTQSNSTIGYMTFNESVIAGGTLKHHDFDVVLSSVNRANSVAYTCEERLSQVCEFTFNAEPKYKEGGLETLEDIEARYEDYLRMKETIPKKQQLMYENGNIFYLAHRVDNRIRRYAKGYEFNYMGCKYIKAHVQLAHGEKVNGDW